MSVNANKRQELSERKTNLSLNFRLDFVFPFSFSVVGWVGVGWVTVFASLKSRVKGKLNLTTFASVFLSRQNLAEGSFRYT